MTSRRLSDFIRDRMQTILQEWEDFARTIEPPALTMDDRALRDHAHQMLTAFADDLETPQTDRERVAKSMGQGMREDGDTAAETHAEARLLSGYTVVQLISEYRALRSAVLSLWGKESSGFQPSHMAEMTRFNEAVDQALAESVSRYELLVKRSQNMFLAILGHDLRNPLGSVMTGASLIVHHADVPPKCTAVAKRIVSSSQRMSGLVNDLIDFTRAQLVPAMPLQPAAGDLVRICEEVIGEIRTYHPDREVRLEAPSTLNALFDGVRVSQMLSNLLGNAIQHGDPNAPVVVRVSESTDAAAISVNNKGLPIPVEQLGAIFEPLVRVGKGNANELGSLGLGLFIARAIANAHNGHLLVSSDATAGTTFTVTLPLKAV